MLHLLADYFTTMLFRNYSIADPSKKEIYVYGFKLLISTVFSIFSILAVSALLDQFALGCIFMMVYIPCRMVSGGYHAKTYSKCYWVSLATYLCVMYAALLPHNTWSLLLIVAFYSLIIIMWAPIINPKHPLSAPSVSRNRRFARIIVAVADGWAIYQIFTRNVSEKVCVVIISLAAVAAMMIFSKIIERREKYERMDSSRNCY